MPAVHHFVATYEPGAVGGHIVEMQRLCHELGWASEVFTEHVRGLRGRDYREYPKTHTLDFERELPDIRNWIADRTAVQ